MCPIFSDEVIRKWAFLYQWENKLLTSYLPAIRDNVSMEISIINNNSAFQNVLLQIKI